MSSLRYKVSRWADTSSLDAWENSQQCLELIEEANKFSTRYHERATGLEAWFTLPDFKAVVAPSKWKMAIAIFIAANRHYQLTVTIYSQSIPSAMAFMG